MKIKRVEEQIRNEHFILLGEQLSSYADDSQLPDADKLKEWCNSLDDKDVAALLLYHCLAVALLKGDIDDNLQKILQDKLSIPAACFKAKWMHYPVVTVQNSNVKTRWFMAGIAEQELDGQSPWIGNCQAIDSASKDAIENAVKAAGVEKRALIFSVTNPGNQVKGSSLGLPTALALGLLQKDHKWPNYVYTTGEVKTDGTVSKVGDLNKKMPADCSCLLVPQDKDIDDRQKIFPVTDLSFAEQALIILTEDIKEGLKELGKYRSYLNNPIDLMKNFKRLPLWVCSLARQLKGDFYDIFIPYKQVDRGGREPDDLFGNLVVELEGLQGNAEKADLLCSLVKCAELQKIADKAEEKLKNYIIDWVSLQQAVNNHTGNHKYDWDCYRKWIDKIKPKCFRAKAQMCNRRLFKETNDFYYSVVNATCQPEIIAAIKKAIKCCPAMEGQDTTFALGTLYGTMGRLYAYRREFESAISSFLSAEDWLAKYDNNWEVRRQYANLMYVGLEKNDENLAIDNLINYFKLEKSVARALGKGSCDKKVEALKSLQQKIPKLIDENPRDKLYLYAALTRFCSQMLKDTSAAKQCWLIFEKIFKETCMEKNLHAAIRILRNTGLIAVTAGKNDQAIQCWQKSYELGWGYGHPAIKFMGVASLAEIAALGGQIDKQKVDAVQKFVDDILAGNTTLNPDHFSCLAQPWKNGDLLHLIRENIRLLLRFDDR